jgi:hypothetical protein
MRRASSATPSPLIQRRNRLQRVLGGWTKAFTVPRLCAAVVDRLTADGTIIETGTDSYRLATTRAGAEQVQADGRGTAAQQARPSEPDASGGTRTRSGPGHQRPRGEGE